jgi:hypothetical protein
MFHPNELKEGNLAFLSLFLSRVPNRKSTLYNDEEIWYNCIMQMNLQWGIEKA